MKKIILSKFILSAMLVSFAFASNTFAEESRTANRSLVLDKNKTNPFHKEEWQKTLPKVWDPINKHPEQWKKSGSKKSHDWEPRLWNMDANSTINSDEVADAQSMHYLQNFYKNRIFHKQYVDENGLLILEVGPKYYKLADVDKRRTVKLLADGFKVFERGQVGFQLRDWHNHKLIGNYTSRGLQFY